MSEFCLLPRTVESYFTSASNNIRPTNEHSLPRAAITLCLVLELVQEISLQNIIYSIITAIRRPAQLIYERIFSFHPVDF